MLSRVEFDLHSSCGIHLHIRMYFLLYICSNVGDILRVIKNAKRDFNFDVYTWDGIDLIFHRTWICI